jgi:hypothetical protein
MTSPRILSSLVFVIGLSCGAHAACDPRDPECTARGSVMPPLSAPYPGDHGPSYGSTYGNPQGSPSQGSPGGYAPAPGGLPTDRQLGNKAERHRRGGPNRGAKIGEARPLQPVRAYLRAKDIPPIGAGAYGLVVFHSKATPANRSKLKMVCTAFVAFFPRNESATVPLADQMITVWPIDDPDAEQIKNDDCDYTLDHYDLIASEAAISDAQLQRATFEGEGPYLVGWSPSNARGAPDKLVLVIDMSADNNQALIDQKFLFWKKQIVENPSRWRKGFSIKRVRTAIRIFADQYGQAMLDAIKLVGGKQPASK